ncbi:35391_t:CDS:1, partial [Racocetra persica]
HGELDQLWQSMFTKYSRDHFSAINVLETYIRKLYFKFSKKEKENGIHLMHMDHIVDAVDHVDEV